MAFNNQLPNMSTEDAKDDVLFALKAPKLPEPPDAPCLLDSMTLVCDDIEDLRSESAKVLINFRVSILIL